MKMKTYPDHYQSKEDFIYSLLGFALQDRIAAKSIILEGNNSDALHKARAEIETIQGMMTECEASLPPMLAIGSNELENNDDLGESIDCPHCQQRHNIEHGKEKNANGKWVESNLLAFYKCGDKSYLAGIDGKKI